MTSNTSSSNSRIIITKRRLGGGVVSAASAVSASSRGVSSDERERIINLTRTVSNKSDDGIDYGNDDEDIDDNDNDDEHGNSRQRRNSSRNINNKRKTTPWRIVVLRLFRLETSSWKNLLPLLRILFLLLFPFCLYQVIQHSSSSISSLWSSFFDFANNNNNNNKNHHIIVEPLALYGKHSRMLQIDDSTKDRYNHVASSRVIMLRGRAGSNYANKIMSIDNVTTTSIHHHRNVMPMISIAKQNVLYNGTYYEEERYPLPKWETKHCIAQYAWQKTTFLNCNTLHELLLVLDDHQDNNNKMETVMQQQQQQQQMTRILGAGYYRDVWVVPNHYYHYYQDSDTPSQVILKSIRFKHAYEPDMFDRNRRDAIAQERLTKSQFVTDIYGFCGGSGLFEYGSGGDMKQLLTSPSSRKRISKLEKLRMGVQAAIAIADVHTVEGGGTIKKPIVAMAHTDISPQQFVIVSHERYHNVHDQHRQGHDDDHDIDEGNRFKLTDFNRMRMLRIDPDQQSPCPFMVKKNEGRFRSPEEYAYLPHTEKVDVYSLGNILYMLLTNVTRLFDKDSTDTAQSKVKHGERPFVSQEIRLSQDPIDQALLRAMNMCHVQEVKERATALQVATFLKANLELIDPGRLESWGVSGV